jgi:hypothetical protein
MQDRIVSNEEAAAIFSDDMKAIGIGIRRALWHFVAAWIVLWFGSVAICSGGVYVVAMAFR